MKEETKITRKKAREHLGQLNLACELAKTIRHCFPDLVALLKQIPDPCNQNYTTYPGVVLLMARILSSVRSCRKITDTDCAEYFFEGVCQKTQA